MFPRLAAACVFGCLATGPAAAQPRQPDGTVVPVGSGLQSIFDARGDPVSATGDAATAPETFIPDCTIEFEVIARDSAYSNAFGWYNATGTRPGPGELYRLLSCADTVGSRPSLDIRADPRYRGGAIGFWIATPEGCGGGACGSETAGCGHIYYTEAAYNDDGSGGVDAWIHRLVYDSRTTPDTFYFGWEDLFRGGDNDFNDLVTIVSHIVCAGAGGDCDTGMPGVCAAGTMQCRSGRLTCTPLRTAGPEVCNGLDDDCNGTADDGAMCPPGDVCAMGRCQPACGGLEFVCSAEQTCVDGICIDNDCLTVTCGTGEVCRGGVCRGACDGVVCPAMQRCFSGRCLDPCDTLTCDAGSVCVDGVCRPPCSCRPCEGGTMCGADGRCADPACATVMCAPGSFCRAGTCVDPCDGAVCPAGQVCTAGECVDVPPGTDAGPPPGTDGGGPPRFDAGGGPAPRPGGVTTTGGCDCRVARGPGDRRAWPALAAVLLFGLVVARRRRH